MYGPYRATWRLSGGNLRGLAIADEPVRESVLGN